MKKLFKFLGIILLLCIGAIAIYYFVNNESLPEGKKGKQADDLAIKMLNALNYDAYKNTESLEWSFRGEHFYKWNKQQNIIDVQWDDNHVVLFPNQPDQNKIISNSKNTEVSTLLKQATDFFNNDSFWLVAPYKVFDEGVERSIVKHNDKDALLVTYTSGGTTPGDSYLWVLDDNGHPTSYKMWTKIIPIGGVEASWKDWIQTDTGIRLPSKHKLSLLGLELDMGTVKASNPSADKLANKILKTIKHEAYKKTNFIEWSFGGRRSYKWNKKEHIVAVIWDTIKVVLHPNNLEKSTIYFNDKVSSKKDSSIIKKAESYFNNDSFWLVAPHKLFEPGIIRNIEKINEQDALRVTYTKGGTTPGDSYVWILDENYLPISYRMDVPSMKMVGVPSTWEDWITTESGTLLPKNHSFGKNGTLSMGDVKAYN